MKITTTAKRLINAINTALEYANGTAKSVSIFEQENGQYLVEVR